MMSPDDPLAIAATKAIQSGDLAAIEALLADNPELAKVRFGSGNQSRTLLHVATDWPGNFPRGAEIVERLVAAGADVNARFEGPHSETPLHWAASSDDVAVLDKLLDLGAEIEAEGAVIGGGTPLADAVAFGQWNAARRLIERGAKANLWQAAGLGLMERVERSFSVTPPPPPEDVTQAFWLACHGSQQRAAEFLLIRGADVNWIGYDQLTPLDAARRSGADDLAEWLVALGASPRKEPG